MATPHVGGYVIHFNFYGKTNLARKNSPLGADMFGPDNNVVPTVAAKNN